MNAPDASATRARIAEPSLADVMDLARRHRRLVFGVPALLLVLVAVVTLIQARAYTSTASFMPQTSDLGRSRLAGLAAQVGLNVPVGDAGQSLGFYADLVRSREILTGVVTTKYSFVTDGDTLTGDLVELFRVQGRSDEGKRAAAIKRLRAGLDAQEDLGPGLVKISLRTRWAPLSQAVLAQILESVSTFNQRRRQVAAAAERSFVETRLGERLNELANAENNAQEFLQRNREYRNSAVLVFQYERLSRELAMRQQIYTSLAQAYEQARIEEVRNTPVITVVDPPELPVSPASRRLALKSLVALALGSLLGLSLAFALELMHREPSA